MRLRQLEDYLLSSAVLLRTYGVLAVRLACLLTTTDVSWEEGRGGGGAYAICCVLLITHYTLHTHATRTALAFGGEGSLTWNEDVFF